MLKFKKILFSPVFEFVFGIICVYCCRDYIHYAGDHTDDYAVYSGIIAGISSWVFLFSYISFIEYIGHIIFSKIKKDKE